jgi:inorganic pyrophosphatase
MQTNLLTVPTFSERGFLHGVIEIPAGTNRKFEFHKEALELRQDLRNGQPRTIDFLPYPVNYGFIPSTRMDKGRGGDGDPLDVLVLAEHQPRGSVMEVVPIALLKLSDLGEQDNKVLAVPANPAERIIRAQDWHSFQQDYSAIRHILELFFMYYDGLGVMTVVGWGDETAALAEVEKWQF